jgi:hypothetical protein
MTTFDPDQILEQAQRALSAAEGGQPAADRLTREAAQGIPALLGEITRVAMALSLKQGSTPIAGVDFDQIELDLNRALETDAGAEATLAAARHLPALALELHELREALTLEQSR